MTDDTKQDTPGGIVGQHLQTGKMLHVVSHAVGEARSKIQSVSVSSGFKIILERVKLRALVATINFVIRGSGSVGRGV